MKRPTALNLIAIAKKKGTPIFESKCVYDYNLNIWGIRSASTDTAKYNDLACVFYQNKKGIWTIDYFDITTDPSNLLLQNPQNMDGTAILCEGFHSKLWSYGFHKGRKDHKALVQFSPCKVYRDNNKDNVINKNLPIQTGIFGINMHRASAYTDNPMIGLYSAGCQVHSNVKRYNDVFIPLIENAVKEAFHTFSYTLILESDLI